MATRRVATIRQGDLGADGEQAQLQPAILDLYSRHSSSLCFGAAVLENRSAGPCVGFFPRFLRIWLMAGRLRFWKFQVQRDVGCSSMSSFTNTHGGAGNHDPDKEDERCLLDYQLFCSCHVMGICRSFHNQGILPNKTSGIATVLAAGAGGTQPALSHDVDGHHAVVHGRPPQSPCRETNNEQ